MNPRTAAASPARQTKTREAAPGFPAARVLDAGLVAVLLGLTFLLGVFPVKDTDLWWHLRTGDLIRQTGWVPTVDTLTFGAAGHRWVDLHWIFQLLVSWGFERGGVAGLNVAKCLVTCLAVGLLVISGRREWPTWVAVLAWVPALLVLSGRMYLRPETLTLLYLATDLAILARWDRRPWLAFALPVVQVCWVNTQGLFVFGPFLIGVALLDAATRRGAFDPDRRAWWRTTSIGSGLAGLACLVNPYGLQGALYPIELLGTMSNPIFKRTIGELKPLPTLFAEVGFDSLPLLMHVVTMAVGTLSFLIPAVWRVVTRLEDRRRARPAPGEPSGAKVKKARKSTNRTQPDQEPERPIRLFRWVLFLTFSGLSLAATRNSHQFAAVVGTVTAWNFAEWAAEVAARWRRRAGGRAPATVVWPRVVTLGVLGLTIALVGSGQFYTWSREGRTIGLGEEPLWYPHAATKFAGGPGMPTRMVGYHNGHPSLFEYYWGPEKKVYTDARLEVMGPDLYQEYLDLQTKVGNNDAGWTDELDRLGRPSVLVDSLDPTNSKLAATLLTSRRWRCVYFDSIASVFVHDSYQSIVQAHEVDFLARHYRHDADSMTDPATLLAMTKALRGVATQVRFLPGGEEKGRQLIWLALDHARRLRDLEPAGLDGFKQAGMLHFLQDPLPGSKPIPRYRMPFDPTIDLSLVESAHDLTRALEINPDDGVSLFYLSVLDTSRGMDEAALPVLERFSRQPDMNLEQQRKKAEAIDQAGEIRHRLGPAPTTKWANLSELEQLVNRLSASGRVITAAAVIEAAHRDDARPWDWADRLATIRLHLGQTARARAIWRSASSAPSPAIQAARVAVTYLVEGNRAAARSAYAEAVAGDPSLFEAHFGLATLEQGAGRANEAVAAARLAAATAPTDRARALVRQIMGEATPYQRPPALSRRSGPLPPP